MPDAEKKEEPTTTTPPPSSTRLDSRSFWTSVVFALLILGFLAGAYFYRKPEDPIQAWIVMLLGALFAAITAVFIWGQIKVDHQVKKLTFAATGGFAVFALVLLAWRPPFKFFPPSSDSQGTEEETPAIEGSTHRSTEPYINTIDALGSSSQTKSYDFEGREGAYLLAVLEDRSDNGALQPTLKLSGPAGLIAERQDEYAAVIEEKLPSAGRYTLSVGTRAGGTGHFAIRAEDLLASPAEKLSSKNDQSRILSGATDYHVYSISAERWDRFSWRFRTLCG